jgi:hypothetical protein
LFQQFLRRQVELILPCVDVGIHWQGEFDDGLLFRFAEEEADGGVFLGEFYFAGVADLQGVVLQAVRAR